jgi:hypothetical protein
MAGSLRCDDLLLSEPSGVFDGLLDVFALEIRVPFEDFFKEGTGSGRERCQGGNGVRVNLVDYFWPRRYQIDPRTTKRLPPCYSAILEA